METVITHEILQEFTRHLIREEKSTATQEKYRHIAQCFAEYAVGQPVTKELVLGYKQKLLDEHYAETSVNGILAGVNSLLHFLELDSCRVKNLKIQKKTYCSEEKELTKKEYLSLLKAAQKDKRLHLIMETICSTGIRVSELQYFTLEAVRAGEIHIRLKGKARVILIPGKLRHKLLAYCQQRSITSGVIFRNRKEKALNRSCIWAMMKKLCCLAGVAASKVFPHNLRKLFARCFYEIEKDIAKLSDILGHSSIDTTRIYIMTTGREHLLQIERLGLVI